MAVGDIQQSLLADMEVMRIRIEGIRTEPDPYEPYLLSQAIRAGDLLFVSGQAGYDNDGQIVPGGFDAQAGQAFANLDRALRWRCVAW